MKKTLNKTNYFGRLKAAIGTAAGGLACAALTAAPAYASSTLDNLSAGIEKGYGKLYVLIIGAAALAALIAAGIWMIAPSDKAAKFGKDWAIRIAVGLLVILCLGGIFAFFQEITAGMGLDISSILKG